LPTVIRDTLLTTLVFLIPGLLISALMSKLLAAPISRLAAFAKIIAAGDYQEHIDIQGAREINILASQFNSMRQAIHNQVASLTKAMDELRNFEQILNSSPVIVYRLRFAPQEWPVEYVSDNIDHLGYSPAQLLSGETSWYGINYPEDLPAVEQFVKEVVEQGKEEFNLESRILTASGDIRWMASWNRFIRNKGGDITHILGMFVDITDRRKAEERDALYQHRLKALAQDLTRAEDNERRHLAEALHDDIGQMLVALNMKLSVLKGTTDRELIQQLVGQVDELMGLIMETCKTLTWQLSPPSLYESNFAAGIEHMAEDLKRFFGLDVEIRSADQRLELKRSKSALLFRCAKELLINVAKHAGSNSPAEVRIEQIEGTVRLVVIDQGKGFDIAEWENGETEGFGLFSLRERLMDVNGSICIESVQGHGTTVTIDVPLAARDIRDASG
jgi:PAS domain S-box-containing protein